jgi:NAD(P)-dependent dehydrogenase (short-subunit alcohol dehydrogenase family)
VSGQLENKVVIVTGASSGMGKATARVLVEAGASVVLVARDEGRLNRYVEELRSAAGRCLGLAVDLALADAPQRIVETAVDAYGQIDGLVHNASVIDVQTIDALTRESVDQQWQVNVAAPLFLTQAALPHMGPGSAIVVVSSTCADVAVGGITAYTATKGAIAAMARSMADELVPMGIRVNVVAPGWVKTPMIEPQFEATPGFEDLLTSRSLVGRLGEPEDIANIIVFLLSPAAGYIDGATIVADGGASASMNLR